MTLPDWPAAAQPYRRTDEFTGTTLPAGLTRPHATRAGTWARLHVLDGQLLFRDLVTGAESTLGPGIHRLIHPERLHEVAPLGAARFFVEFCRLPCGETATSDPFAGAPPQR